MPSETVSDGIFKTPRPLPALRGTQGSLIIRRQTQALPDCGTKPCRSRPYFQSYIQGVRLMFQHTGRHIKHRPMCR
ncbi:TPA: hypothetical protein ACLA64_001550, partial [Neisseria meningitidis]